MHKSYAILVPIFMGGILNHKADAIDRMELLSKKRDMPNI